jgi:hypothetical protein
LRPDAEEGISVAVSHAVSPLSRWPVTAIRSRLRDDVTLPVGAPHAGGYAWTENQAQELAYMVRYGMTPMQAIKSATSRDASPA